MLRPLVSSKLGREGTTFSKTQDALLGLCIEANDNHVRLTVVSTDAVMFVSGASQFEKTTRCYISYAHKDKGYEDLTRMLCMPFHWKPSVRCRCKLIIP